MSAIDLFDVYDRFLTLYHFVLLDLQSYPKHQEHFNPTPAAVKKRFMLVSSVQPELQGVTEVYLLVVKDSLLEVSRASTHILSAT